MTATPGVAENPRSSASHTAAIPPTMAAAYATKNSVLLSDQHPTNVPRRAADADALELQRRIDLLLDSCMLRVFYYIRQGLFDRDKLTVLAMLALQVQLKVCTTNVVDHDSRVRMVNTLVTYFSLFQVGAVDAADVALLCRPPRTSSPPAASEETLSWLGVAGWQAVNGLAGVCTQTCCTYSCVGLCVHYLAQIQGLCMCLQRCLATSSDPVMIGRPGGGCWMLSAIQCLVRCHTVPGTLIPENFVSYDPLLCLMTPF